MIKIEELNKKYLPITEKVIEIGDVKIDLFKLHNDSREPINWFCVDNYTFKSFYFDCSIIGCFVHNEVCNQFNVMDFYEITNGYRRRNEEECRVLNNSISKLPENTIFFIDGKWCKVLPNIKRINGNEIDLSDAIVVL